MQREFQILQFPQVLKQMQELMTKKENTKLPVRITTPFPNLYPDN